MPFLRRRGNLASETDMRRHTVIISSQHSEDDAPRLPSPKAEQPFTLDEFGPLSQHKSLDERPKEQTHDSVGTTESNKPRRFSILRHRNASDPQLSLRAKQQADVAPPVPRPPAIITTAPTNDTIQPKKVASRLNLAARFRRSEDVAREHSDIWPTRRNDEAAKTSTEMVDKRYNAQRELASTQKSEISPGAGQGTSSPNQDEHLKSEESLRGSTSQSHLSVTPKRSRGTTPLFWLRMPKKAPEPLFPLDHLPQMNKRLNQNASCTSLDIHSAARPFSSRTTQTGGAATSQDTQDPDRPSQLGGLASSLARNGPRSSQSSPTRVNMLRGRSSTMSSVGRDSTDEHLLPPTARTSTSTGRKSFGDLFSLSRIKQNSELSRQGTLSPGTPASIGSKSNSLQLPRGSVVLPERLDDESPAKYLGRLEGTISRGAIAAAVSKGSDSFSSAVLRSYMRTFSFFGDPMDMALRKMLMEAELPKETQHIDRCLQAFANRYHECNPGIYSSPDQAYFIAFSLLILHTDVFNKNNKHKMQKVDYLKNTRGEGIFDDILECFYDNISYTPFIRVEDDFDISNTRANTFAKKSKKKQILPSGGSEPAKRASKEPVDPYTLILDGNLDALRPNLKDAMPMDDHYNYLGTASHLNLGDLQKTFFKTGVLQIVSARSRPDAFMSEKTVTNPDDAHPGIVDIKVTKVGLLWRKEAKKRKTRSPWQEWGAILTGAQLYFFRNTSWIKNLMHQHEIHIKSGQDGIPVIFKPPLEEFKPDAFMSTHAAVALIDTAYKKHKNAFVYVRQGGLDEVLLADSDEERNDWLAKLNYAAAFRTSGVRMRGVLGANYDGQGRRGMRRLDSSDATQLVQTPTGPVTIARGHIDQKMADDIQVARRDGMQQKIQEAENRVEESQKLLDEQLRNARHLQIMAPIQPRTREQLLSAAARMSSQLKCTRMEIWREKCHRDILSQDLADDSGEVVTESTSALETDNSPSTPRANLGRLESKSKRHSIVERSPQTPLTGTVSHISSSTEKDRSYDSPSRRSQLTSPPITLKQQPASISRSRSEVASSRRGSASSLGASETSAPSTQANKSVPDTDNVSTPRPHDNGYEVDADERDFLKQAGLWEGKSSRESLEKGAIQTSPEAIGQNTVADRDKLERSKIRRSLQRTLRESAGHLSHHRSRRGREGGHAGPGSSEEGSKEATLSRGTGSFVVHGKKASVIRLGSEFQTLSQDDKILARKPPNVQQTGLQATLSNDEPDEDYHSAAEMPSDSSESQSRRGSAASASTATARSFRELHRKYSSAQATRSSSIEARLALTSDGDSDDGGSLSDGRRSIELRAAGLPESKGEYIREGNRVGEAEIGDSDDEIDEDDGDDEYRPEHSGLTTRQGQTVKV